MKLMPAAFAAAASPSISAPGSLACRRLMTDAYPIFFNPATAAGVVAPAHAIVVSRRAKFVTPGTVSLVTPWAFSVTTSAASTQVRNRCIRLCIGELLFMKGDKGSGWKDGGYVTLAASSGQRRAACGSGEVAPVASAASAIVSPTASFEVT